MKGKGTKPQDAVDIDAILLREVAARRSPSGSVLDQEPGGEATARPVATTPEQAVQEQAPGPSAASPPEAPVPRRGRRAEVVSAYEELFLRGEVVRQRSVIYIGEQTKQALTDVVQSLSGGRVSVTTFVERILAHHLEVFREEINRLHRVKNNKDIL